MNLKSSERSVEIRNILRWLRRLLVNLSIVGVLSIVIVTYLNYLNSNKTPGHYHGKIRESSPLQRKQNTEAIISLYTGDSFLPGLVVLGYTLHKFNATVERDMILLIPENAINNTHHLSMLNRMGWTLLYVKPISFPGKVTPRLAHGLLKLYAWNLTQYTAVSTLDADTMLIDTIEEPFRCLRENSSVSFLAAINPRLFHRDKRQPHVMFNAGVLFFRPNIQHFYNLMCLSQNKTYYSLSLPQQNLLNNYFRYQWTNLSMVYNLQENANKQKKIWLDQENRARIVHFAGAGFIGSNLAERLLRDWNEYSPYRVIIVDSFTNYYSSVLKHRNIDNLVKRYAHRVRDGSFVVIHGSINDQNLMKTVFHDFRITHVAHLAALPAVRLSIYDAGRFMETNYDGTRILLERSIEHHVSVFVFASTSSVYGRTKQIPFTETDSCDKPLSVYAATKRAAEILCHVYHNLYGLNVTVLRFFNVYGPKGRPDMMPAQLLQASVNSSKQITIFNNGSMMRDWTYVDDVVSAFVQALAKPMGYEIFNVGYGYPVKLSKFIEYIERLTKNAHVRLNARFANASSAEPLITFANVSKACRMLRYKPIVPLFSGLKKTWQWFRNEKNPF